MVLVMDRGFAPFPFCVEICCSLVPLGCIVLIYFFHDNVVSQMSWSHFSGFQSISSVLLGTVSGR